MDLGSFFRHFFEGPFHPFPRQPEDGPNRDEPPVWNDRTFNGHHFPPEFEQLDMLMKQMMQDTLASLPEVFVQLNTMAEPPPTPKSLREQMLKPQESNLFAPLSWEDNGGDKQDGLAETLSKPGRLELLFPRPREDSNMHYSSRSWSSFTTRNMDGATVTKSSGTDREGCTREMTTHERDGKRYSVEKRRCPGDPEGHEQTSETLVNLTHQELPEFLRQWHQQPLEQPSAPQQDPNSGIKDPELFNKFFGPSKK